MWKTRLVNALLTVAIVVVLAIVFALVFSRWSFLRPGPRVLSTPVILQQVQGMSQLVTVKYVMEKIVVYEDPSLLGNNRLELLVHANVSAGINLSDIKPGDVTVSGKQISLKLPPARAPILHTEIDETRTRVLDRTTGFFRTYDQNMEQTARKIAVADINKAAQDAGILKDAQDRAETQLSNLFVNVMGFERVEFRK